VTVDGGALRLELGTFRTPLVPTSATDFLERNFLGRVTFGANPSGKVDRLIYRYAGKEFAAKRLTAN
jgi:hypothetical protein